MQYVLSCMILAFVGVGIWLLVIGIRGFLLKRKHLPHMQRVEGTIIDVEQRNQGTSTQRGTTTTTYSNHPVIQFTSASGEVVTFTSEEGDLSKRRRRTPTLEPSGSYGTTNSKSTSSEYQKGDKLSVLYDPDGVVKPVVDSGSTAFKSEIYMMLGGAVFVAVGAIIVALFGGRIIAELPF